MVRPRFGHHPVLPLYWCNNKYFNGDAGCKGCNISNFGTDYYFCEDHHFKYHKKCVESPLKIKYPLQLYFDFSGRNNECLCCGETGTNMVYHCSICQVFMHSICTMKPIPFVIYQPKRHDHPLTFFPRQTSLTCNSCRQRVDCDYGAYTCDKCSDYAVHSRCVLGENVWDGEELEGVPEEDDITQDASPFDIISERVIFHFLHDHHLRFEVNILYNENRLCQACVLPIYEGNLYSCIECEFVLHRTCGMTPRDCAFDLDVRCALISELFDYKAHEHPLFLALDQINKPICEVCKKECQKQINCIKCNYILCFKCATLSYKARDIDIQVFYWCKECCTTFHIECLFGEVSYMNP
ncbi:hypothetical protein EUTSA_v10023993mg, partial [Eutrema salsugineum]